MSKRPPPVPKFYTSIANQTSKKDEQLQKKLDSFFTQLSKQAHSAKQPVIQTKKQLLVKQQSSVISNNALEQQNLLGTSSAPVIADKKKLNLANINSKLNTMLTSKKINLNIGANKSIDSTKPSNLNPEKLQKKRSQLTIQYDPNHPNNYDISKSYYLDKMAQLDKQSDDEEQDKKIINQTGIGMKKLAQEDQQLDDNQITNPIIEEEILEQKQQIALRMMQKFGYKVGSGLGKQSQGITTPLTIKKTTDSACIIQQSAINLNQIIKPQISAKNALLAHNIAITEVIVFINLIKIQELTQEVQKQLKEQCLSFGQLKNWLVFLLKDNQGKQQLRIFAEYQTKQASFNAFTNLNNRYYDKNLASLRFYPKNQFQTYQLNLRVHEHIQT